MATLLKKGTPVQVVTHIPAGVVLSASIVEGDQIAYLVEYTDAAGNKTQRHFRENELKVVEPAKAK